MNYLNVEDLSKSYGEKLLLDNISFGLERGQKVALIAPNGAGKSTLIRLILGSEIPDEGSITCRGDIRIASLDQNPVFDSNLTIAELIQKATQGQWESELRCEEILSRLKVGDLQQKIAFLSGGQKKKLALAFVLIQEADLLILDEPTNHLDLEMTEWLEDHLRRRKLTLFLITHDRSFLDNVCDEILELDRAKLYRYKGNYTYFLEKKAEREMIERAEIEKARNTYRRELDWMRRMPSARGTKAKARKDAFYEVKEVASRSLDTKKPELSVRSERLGGKILEMYNVCKSYDHRCLIHDYSHVFKRGEKVGIVGPNGIGKSTLLNMIMGSVQPDNGRIVVGQTVKIGYYSQDGLMAAADQRVIDIIKDTAEVVVMGDHKEISASQFLTYFNFPPETQYNYFGNLSGGERRRLYLLKTLMINPNFLILDEPTNDLDVFTLMMLEEFLSDFEGCLIMVSHDRSFMDNLVDHLLIFEGDGRIKDFHGTYSEYRQQQALVEREANKQEREQKKNIELPKTPSNTKPKATFKQKQEFAELEKDIALLEQERQELEAHLSSGTGSLDEISQWSSRIGSVLSELESKEIRWLELSDIVDV